MSVPKRRHITFRLAESPRRRYTRENLLKVCKWNTCFKHHQYLCVVFQHFGTVCVHVVTPIVVPSTLLPLPAESPALKCRILWWPPRENIEILIRLCSFLKFTFGIPSGDLTESHFRVMALVSLHCLCIVWISTVFLRHGTDQFCLGL
jgi:hypothetical protein